LTKILYVCNLWTLSQCPEYIAGVPVVQALIRTLTMDTDPISSSLVFRVVDVIWHISLMTSDEQAIEGTEIDDTFHENVVQTVLSIFSDDDIGHDVYETILSTIEHLEHRIGSAVSPMLKIKETLRDFQIIRTEQGYIGLAYPEVKPQNRVCIMYNCGVPHIMRKSDNHYVNIGPCWIYGLMQGEAVEILAKGPTKLQRFEIV
jgi:hypothetical protein